MSERHDHLAGHEEDCSLVDDDGELDDTGTYACDCAAGDPPTPVMEAP